MKISEADLRSSRILRNSVKEYKGFYFFQSQKAPKSFKKLYTSAEQEKLDAFQSYQQSSLKKELDKFEAVAPKSIEAFKENVAGEEGVDYIKALGDMTDPTMPNSKLLER